MIVANHEVRRVDEEILFSSDQIRQPKAAVLSNKSNGNNNKQQDLQQQPLIQPVLSNKLGSKSYHNNDVRSQSSQQITHASILSISRGNVSTAGTRAGSFSATNNYSKDGGGSKKSSAEYTSRSLYKKMLDNFKKRKNYQNQQMGAKAFI